MSLVYLLHTFWLSLVFSYSFFFLMIRRPPRSTLSSSSAASDVYKRQIDGFYREIAQSDISSQKRGCSQIRSREFSFCCSVRLFAGIRETTLFPVSYTHLRAHETDSYLVCRLLLEKKKNGCRTSSGDEGAGHRGSSYGYSTQEGGASTLTPGE